MTGPTPAIPTHSLLGDICTGLQAQLSALASLNPGDRWVVITVHPDLVGRARDALPQIERDLRDWLDRTARAHRWPPGQVTCLQVVRAPRAASRTAQRVAIDLRDSSAWSGSAPFAGLPLIEVKHRSTAGPTPPRAEQATDDPPRAQAAPAPGKTSAQAPPQTPWFELRWIEGDGPKEFRVYSRRVLGRQTERAEADILVKPGQPGERPDLSTVSRSALELLTATYSNLPTFRNLGSVPLTLSIDAQQTKVAPQEVVSIQKSGWLLWPDAAGGDGGLRLYLGVRWDREVEIVRGHLRQRVALRYPMDRVRADPDLFSVDLVFSLDFGYEGGRIRLRNEGKAAITVDKDVVQSGGNRMMNAERPEEMRCGDLQIRLLGPR